mmetsp:Transcript_30145/g.71827  ORF Transcript_30145/g.71827 Transcript_30145/m.71827 type:complete len:222 (-) Transcript_30145:348-1013(-)
MSVWGSAIIACWDSGKDGAFESRPWVAGDAASCRLCNCTQPAGIGALTRRNRWPMGSVVGDAAGAGTGPCGFGTHFLAISWTLSSKLCSWRLSLFQISWSWASDKSSTDLGIGSPLCTSMPTANTELQGVNSSYSSCTSLAAALTGLGLPSYTTHSLSWLCSIKPSAFKLCSIQDSSASMPPVEPRWGVVAGLQVLPSGCQVSLASSSLALPSSTPSTAIW